MTFATLGLHPGLLKALAAAGYQSPTPVQTQTIPLPWRPRSHGVVTNRIGEDRRFILPAIHLLATTEQATSPAAAGNPHKRGATAQDPRVLECVVLTPTRELALQVTAANRQVRHHVGR
jgi:superfamily II DNA/RNA helicase